MWQRLSRLVSDYWARCSGHGRLKPPLLRQALLVVLLLLGDGWPGDCRSRGSEVCCYFYSCSCSCSCSSSYSCSCSYSSFCSSCFSCCFLASQGRWTSPLDWLIAWLRFRLPTVLQHTGELGDVDVDVDVNVMSARHSVYSDSVICWLLSPTGCSPAKSTCDEHCTQLLGREDVEWSRGGAGLLSALRRQTAWWGSRWLTGVQGLLQSVRSRWAGEGSRRGEATPLAWLSSDPRSALVLVGDWLKWGGILLWLLCRTAVSTV